jgi:hypothetical protein
VYFHILWDTEDKGAVFENGQINMGDKTKIFFSIFYCDFGKLTMGRQSLRAKELYACIISTIIIIGHYWCSNNEGDSLSSRPFLIKHEGVAIRQASLYAFIL